jgi:hypothetical protein
MQTAARQVASMIRLALVMLAILSVLAVLWMVLPVERFDATEIGFDPGDPDPNVYTSTMDLGWPLPWISWVSSGNEAAGYDESEFKLFRPLNFTVHVLAILTPLAVLLWMRRAKAADTAKH